MKFGNWNWIAVGFVLMASTARAEALIHWKCEQDSRPTGGAFESVKLESNQSLKKLVFNYIPAEGSGLPAIENQVLVEDLHCRFYSVKEIVQCVSTNFKRYLETKYEDSGSESQKRLKVVIQSDQLIWPKEYRGEKANGSEVFTVDLNSTLTDCGY